MAFCSSCGEKMKEDAAFCHNCGKPTSPASDTEEFVPELFKEREKEGEDFKIKRCPSCGQGIKSFMTTCPACGNEISSEKISETLVHFISQVSSCEESIAKTKRGYKSGFFSWGNGKKIFWIILNLVLLFIPLGVYLILPLFRVKTRSKLNLEENRLASLIENYPIPNDREAILETLIYAKDKVDFISKERSDKTNVFWLKLWSQKAEQLKQKADLLFPGDEVAKRTYEEILNDNKGTKLSLRLKALLGVCVIFFAIFFGSEKFNELQVSMEPLELLKVPDSELGSLLPDLTGVYGNVGIDSTDYISLRCFKITTNDYEKYLKKCKDEGYTIDPDIYTGFYEAYNEEGYRIRLSYYDKTLNVSLKKKIEMREFKWPSSKLAKICPPPVSTYGYISDASDNYVLIYVGNTSIDDFSKYVTLCEESGFNQEISQYDKRYQAKNKDGVELYIRYEGFQTMQISLSNFKNN